MLRVVIGLVLLAHGIGHSMGLVQILKVATVNPDWQGDSWLLTGIAGMTATQIVGSLLWTGSMIGFARWPPWSWAGCRLPGSRRWRSARRSPR